MTAMKVSRDHRECRGAEALEFRELTDAEPDLVSGGDDWARSPEGRAPANPDGTACGNAILVWSGIGATIGSLGGSFITVMGGWAIGGGLAARYSRQCRAAQ